MKRGINRENIRDEISFIMVFILFTNKMKIY